MNWLVRALPIVLIAPCLATPTHGQIALGQTQSRGTDVGVSILSDTKGIAIDPYMKTVIPDLRAHWQHQLADAHLSVPSNSGASIVDLTIGSDGSLLALHLESTENSAYDKAAWNAAKSMHYAALPSSMKDATLKLKVEFYAN